MMKFPFWGKMIDSIHLYHIAILQIFLPNFISLKWNGKLKNESPSF